MRSSLEMAIKGLLAGGVVVAMATSTYAVTQGDLGFTSTGSVEISLNVADEVQINNLVDIDLGDFTGADLTGSTPACIFRNGGNAGFQLTASGNGTAGAYTLADAGAANLVGYSVSINTGGADSDLDANTPATFTTATSTPDCVGITDNATITVTVDAADAATLPATAYTGTLTLVVAPN